MSQRFAPTGLVHELRNFHANSPKLLDGDMLGFKLRRLPWGSSDRCYAWKTHASFDDKVGEVVCLKLYTSDPWRAQAEAQTLRWLARTKITGVPRMLWRDTTRPVPASTMTLLHGDPVSAIFEPAPQILDAIVATVRAVHMSDLDSMESRWRADIPALEGLPAAQRWSAELTACHDTTAQDVRDMVAAWLDFDDVRTLAQPATPVFSPGNANLGHWLWNNSTQSVGLINWSTAGRSDAANVAAHLMEHPTGRLFSDEHWISLLPALGVDDTNLDRFRAAQRASAMHWLRYRWQQREWTPNKLSDQLDRARAVLSHSLV